MEILVILVCVRLLINTLVVELDIMVEAVLRVTVNTRLVLVKADILGVEVLV